MLKVLDLFSGLGGFSQAFKDRGHDVTTVELLEHFNPDICADVMTLGPEDLQGPWDIVLASPPCNAFSRAAIPHYWDGYFIPKNKKALKFIALAYYTKWLIRALPTRYSIIENPFGQLRAPLLFGRPAATICFCRYNDSKNPPMKKTDLWGELPPFEIKNCKNENPFCDHVRAPRGSKNGIQGLPNPEERAKIPYGLSLAICEATEGVKIKKQLKMGAFG